MLFRAYFAQIAAAEHGHERQADDPAYQHRRADGYGKLAEQTAHQAGEKEQGDENGHQRQGHGKNGETNLARAVSCCLHPAFAHLQVADNVFQHHDGVVDHKAHGQGQGHERHGVEAVTEQIHDRKGADQRHGKRQAGDDRGAQVADKEKDHQHHQGQGQQQGELDVMH